MGKKKTKKISGAEKTELKTQKKLSKLINKEALEKGEDNIEALMLKCSNRNIVDKVVETKCNPPSPRCNMTLNGHPEKDTLIMFGGEYYNGKETNVYNDLFFYNIRNNSWTQVMIPNSPLPRCSHQAVTLPHLGGQLWIFGGEFISSSQTQYHHYNEMWCLHLADLSWQKIQNTPGGPSARSGHRMVACKKLLILFGGFYDNSREFKYFNDVHIFNVETMSWLSINIAGTPPPLRSGCVLVATQDQRNIVVYGGYSKERMKKETDKGHIYTDMYMLSLENSKNVVDDYTKWRWVTVKQSGQKPSPRCSMSLAVAGSNKAILFGGVNDEDENDEGMKSNFFNDMYRLEVDKGRWHLIDLLAASKSNPSEKKRRRRVKDAICVDNAKESDDEDVDDDDVDDLEVGRDIKKLKVKEESRNLSGKPDCEMKDKNDFTSTSGKSMEKPTLLEIPADPLSPAVFSPSPRMRPMLATKRGILYLYGGVFEDEKDRVCTLSDFYSIDIQKLDKWNIIIAQDDSKMDWIDSSSEDDDNDEDDDEDGESNDESTSSEDDSDDEGN